MRAGADKMNGMNLITGVVLYLLAVIALIVLSRLTQKEAGRNRKARELAGGELEFAPDAVAQNAARVLIGLFTLLGLSSLVQAVVNHHGLIAGLLFVGLGLVLARLLPGTIVLTGAGLEQMFWLGKPKQMRWKDVQVVNVHEKKRRVAISGRGGVRIVQYKQLPDMERLLAELAAHCPEAMPRTDGKRTVEIPPPVRPVVAPPEAVEKQETTR